MPKTLLLADDSVTIQKVVGITFATEDTELITESNGDAALARAKQITPDLVLADLRMPGLSGYELCAALKAEPSLAHVPVLLLTGPLDGYDEARTREVGADGYISKPFDAQALVDLVHSKLKGGGGTKAPEPPLAEATVIDDLPSHQPSAAPRPAGFIKSSDTMPTAPMTETKSAPDFHFDDFDPAEASAPIGADKLVTTENSPATSFESGGPTDTPPISLPGIQPIHGETQSATLSGITPNPINAAKPTVTDSVSPASSNLIPREPLPEDTTPTMEASGPLHDREHFSHPQADSHSGTTGHQLRHSPTAYSQTFSLPTSRQNREPDSPYSKPAFDTTVAKSLPENFDRVPADPNKAIEPSGPADFARPEFAAPPDTPGAPAGTNFKVGAEPSTETQKPAVAIDPTELHSALEKVAWEAFGSLSEQLVSEIVQKIEQVAWEVVPQLAERLIEEEIRKLKDNQSS